MKAIILAAGRGQRMMPLTANMPKPMLPVLGQPLLTYHIKKLAAAGITDLVINHAWCGDKIVNYYGDGNKFGVNIHYSDESSGALETAGGIKKALPWLVNSADDYFLVVNGDVYCDFSYQQLPTINGNILGHLWLVENPPHNINGDFTLCDGYVHNLSRNEGGENSLTFSGIALYKASFFDSIDNVEGYKQALGPLLRKAAEQALLTGSKITTSWFDIGTPERLAQLNQYLSAKS